MKIDHVNESYVFEESPTAKEATKPLVLTNPSPGTMVYTSPS